MILHYFFVLLFILSNIFILFSDNPVHSVLFLILSFCNAATILFIFNVDFLGLVFIIIYVGAIAILFLFIVMMLNIKITSYVSFLKLPLILITSCFIIIQFYFYLKYYFVFNQDVSFFGNFKINFLFDNLENADVIGQVLFNYFLVCFLLAGLILLVAMVGAISLTLNFRSERKNELVIRQLSRSDNFITFFK